MLNVITSSNPDVRPAVPARPSVSYDHPAIWELRIKRYDINASPTAEVLLRNFRDMVDTNGDPVLLPDGVTQKAEYGPIMRTRTIEDLYAWVAVQPNAADIVGALNTLLDAVGTWDESLKAAEVAASSSSSSG